MKNDLTTGAWQLNIGCPISITLLSTSDVLQLLILSFCQDDQVPNATYYDQFTTRVEIARQAEVCYYTPDLLDTKCVELSCNEYDTLTPAEQKNIREAVEQEYLACLFINNSNQKLHSQLKKDVANNYSKGNMEAYPSDIHKALTLMNEYKPLKLDVAPVPAQGTALPLLVVKAKGRKLPAEPSTLATLTGGQ
jgi:hypothetical protein